MQSLSRALSVLDLLGRQGSPQTLTDITKHVGLHKSTVHRMLATFVDYGLVRRDEANRYLVGRGAVELARVAQGEAPWSEVVRTPLAALSDFACRPAIFAVPRGNEMVITNVARPRDADDGGPVVGDTTPMHAAAMGMAYLAHRQRYELERYVDHATFDVANTRRASSASTLIGALMHVRDRGYAFENDETPATATAIAMPVLGTDGFAIAAVQLSVVAGTYGPDLHKLAKATRVCAERMSTRLSAGGPRTLPALSDGFEEDRRGA